MWWGWLRWGRRPGGRGRFGDFPVVPAQSCPHDLDGFRLGLTLALEIDQIGGHFQDSGTNWNGLTDDAVRIRIRSIESPSLIPNHPGNIFHSRDVCDERSANLGNLQKDVSFFVRNRDSAADPDKH